MVLGFTIDPVAAEKELAHPVPGSKEIDPNIVAATAKISQRLLALAR